MRPLRLELKGFGAFRDDTTVDFADADFFALVGPTGSGKSTVIDAICFALFGSVPRLDDRKLVAPVMSTGASETKVLLAFEVGGVEHVAVRVLRRDGKGKVGTKEARLERVDGTILAGRETEMRTAVPELLGLDFEDFTRCVVLPQGEFARFLHQDPRERQALLVRLLDLSVYGRLASRAHSRASAADTELKVAEARRADLRPHDDEALAGAEAALAAARAVATAIDAATTEVAALDAERGAAERAVGEHETLLRGLAAVSLPAGLGERAASVAAAVEIDVQAAETDRLAAAALEQAEQAAAECGPVAEWERLLAVHDRLAKGRRVVDERAAAVAATLPAAEASALAVDAAEATLVRASAALEAIDLAHRAHAIAVTLRPGEPCPVCEQPVATLPMPASPVGREAAERDLAAAQHEVTAARTAAAAAADAVRAAEQQHAMAVELLAQLGQDVEGRPGPDEARTRLDAATAAAATLEAARAAAKRSRAEHESARQARARAEQAAAGDADGYHAQRDPLARHGAPPPGPDIATSWAALAAWAQAERVGADAALAAARAELDGLDQRRRGIVAAAREALVAAGAAPPRGDQPGDLAAAASALATRAELDVDAIVAARASAAGLEADIARAGAAKAVASELAKLLKADRFQRWLVEATLSSLAERASATLRRLSSGQYSLRHVDDDFLVVDHTAADETRPVRTLSGGETFQASLALALALSDQLVELSGRGTRRLDSIFLDEGFGTLDPDTLETVAGTIEALGGQGRMVGIVTHVRELADRVPVRFQVRKGPRGSTVERVSA